MMDELERRDCERSLAEFVRCAWSSIDSAPFQMNWHINALCDHLEAVTRGEIRFLVVNLPPRCAKTLITSVCWPIWAWLQKDRSISSGPGVRFLCASYGDDLALDHAQKMRDLIQSPWFQKRWGKRIHLRQDKSQVSDFAIKEGGGRMSTSIRSSLIGKGGDVVVIDDPHNTEQAESEADRERALRGWREISSTRLNDPRSSPIVVIMQRLHEEDVTGTILESENREEWVHLMIPMRYDAERDQVLNGLVPGPLEGWQDPRPELHATALEALEALGPDDPALEVAQQAVDEAWLMWPERFGEAEVVHEEIQLGPYMASGRLQQSPTPTGGAIIKREWWQVWDEAAAKENGFDQDGETLVFPDCYHILQVVDTAFKEDEENDWNACTVWGLWRDRRERPKAVLIEAWTCRKPLTSEDERPKQDGERSPEFWGRIGLVSYVLDTARRRKVDTLLICSNARAVDLTNELRLQMRGGEFTIETFSEQKHGDKVARLYAAQPVFAAGMVYAPDRPWAEAVINQVAQVPKGKHDDLADTVSAGMIHLRRNNMLLMAADADEERDRANTFRPMQGSVSEHYLGEG